MTASQVTCANCGQPLQATFCGSCGEKRPGHEEYSITHVVQHALHDVFHFDSKIFRTIGPLLLKPGFLTAEYLAGRRQRYVKPITLFVLLNVVFFLVGYRMGLFNWKLNAYLGDLGWLLQGLIDSKVAERGITEAVLASEFYEIAKDMQRTMFFFAIPIFGVVLKVFFWRHYYVEHLIYSIHFHAFFTLFCVTAIPLMVVLFSLLALAGLPGPLHFLTRDPGLVLPLIAGMAFYHCIALRRVYAAGRWTSIAVGAALTVVEPLVWLYVFRPLVFLAIYWMLP